MELKDFLSMTRMPFAFTQTLFIILGFLHSSGSDYSTLMLAVLALGPSFIYGGIYILNDLADRQSDLHHPKKKNRAITSGRVKVGTAITLSIILIAIGIAMAAFIGKNFLLISLAILANNLIYAFGPRLKDRLYLGLLSCSMNYPLRFLAGSVAATSGSIAVLPAAIFFFIALNGFSSYRIYNRKSEHTVKQEFKQEKTLVWVIRLTSMIIAVIVIAFGIEKTPLAAPVLAACLMIYSEANLRIVIKGEDFFQLLRAHKTLRKRPDLAYYPIMAGILVILVTYVILAGR